MIPNTNPLVDLVCPYLIPPPGLIPEGSLKLAAAHQRGELGVCEQL